MEAVRFHGRGGQGAKTASRILGTAAFLSGLIAQDSPIYGAERRGAPVAAFTRIAREPIRERGVIAHPDVLCVADASLIEDPTAHVADGVAAETLVFVNSPFPPEEVVARTAIPGKVTTLDLTDLALQRLGQREAISALLGAVAARLVLLPQESVQEAIARELGDLGLNATAIERNQSAARYCYDRLEVPAKGMRPQQGPGSAAFYLPTYEPPTRGSARISAAANSVLRETSGWRTFRPILQADKCNGCWLCFAFCPDGVIAMDQDDKPVIDYAHCKGCQICVHECPTHALVAEREQAGGVAWAAK
ncbi:MAG: hypothetical protein NBKEAIPA_03213 [Nitrospirae bacterium]|nr:hypothetical protein [Nitrospirota bacterium]MCE7966348.1 4Fe-4S dicluster domain-containing protein [Nitrospira sp. NTP2]MCK6492005.1 2-oxoacid:acceptor oxidoreductase family protein [Nitrospira sp.]MEB2338862.1 2-oxoacid:acceptor oxidoreductase family protein [Nitrospirales bacterium]RIK60567.1 MAG: hypothetical protein DCC63_02755 [Nitrospira sp.]